MLAFEQLLIWRVYTFISLGKEDYGIDAGLSASMDRLPDCTI